MTYDYNPGAKYSHVRAYTFLTNNISAFILAALVILSLAVWLSFLLFVPSDMKILGLVLILSSLATTHLFAFAFGKTYFPNVASLYTPKQLKKITGKQTNVAYAASFELMQALGPYSINKSETSIAKSIDLLFYYPDSARLLNWMQIDPDTIKQYIQSNVAPSLTWEKYAQRMLNLAVSLKEKNITPEHAIGALLLQPAMAIYLRTQNLTEKDIKFVLWWGTKQRLLRRWRRRWWDESRLLSFSGIGLSWASGLTTFVDKFTRIPRGNEWDDIIYGHENKVDELINTLARKRQSNVLLVGEPGVGRLGILRQVARLIRNGVAHPELKGQRVLYINASQLMAQGKTAADQAAIVLKALTEMEKAGNIVAMIDGLSSLLSGAGEQRINLSNLLIPFLSSSTVRVVVIVSTSDYHTKIKVNPELIQYFEVVQVPNLSNEDTMRRIALTLPYIEKSANLDIPYQTLRTLVTDTASILPQVPFPERAFDILEEAIVLAQENKAKQLAGHHIHTIITRKLGINFGALKQSERQRLLDLEKTMHKRIVNQSTAVKTVVRAMIRARAEIKSKDRPIGTFLFLGPTGVGKTETAKTLAASYFGSEHNMLRYDMSEFQGSEGAMRLIGGSKQPSGLLTSQIADHPFSVLLLDEFEKASKEVHQLFLQVFDEGNITDYSGKHFSFLHSIIIATSNAGAELIRRTIKGGAIPEGFNDKLKEHILRNNILRPELLNRFDAVVTFSPLTSGQVKQIARLMLQALNKKLDSQHGITVDITDELLGHLIKIGYDPEFGARPMARAIQDTVEYYIAQQIVKQRLVPGQRVSIPISALQEKQG